MKAYPLKFEPIFKQRIWGGQKLHDFFGKELPAGGKIGESWELTDLPEDKSAFASPFAKATEDRQATADRSVIANGELKGLTLNEAIRKFPKEITGDANFKLPFPLLIKFIDAEDILSVQVHPDEETCKRMGKGEPKTECWYIVEATPGAFIYKGVKKGVTKDEFAKAIKKGNVVRQAHHIVEALLQKVYVKAGECHYLPAGTVHSLGAGLIIAEIQMPSDTTYRVYDFNRLDDKGKPRPLHIEEAMESIHFGDSESTGCETVTTTGRLVDSKYFKVDKGQAARESELLLTAGKMKVLIITVGSGRIKSAGGKSEEFKAGDVMLIPADYEGTMVFVKKTEYLTVMI